MYTSHATVIFLGFSFAAQTLALPLLSFSPEEAHPTALPGPSQSISPPNRQEIPGTHDADSIPRGERRIQLALHPEDAGVPERSPRLLPLPPTHTFLARDIVDPDTNSSNSNTDSCQAAVNLLRADFAGHGLPLTSLVIESSTFVLLAGFVLYFFLWRCKMRRQAECRNYGSTTTTPLSFSFHRQSSTVKHTPPTPAQPSLCLPSLSLSKIDEDSLPPTPTYPAPPCYSHPSALSPLRSIPASPVRSVSRCASINLRSCTGSGAGSALDEGSSLEDKPSFLSLKG